jgi:transcriptional regulator of heat shock response
MIDARSAQILEAVIEEFINAGEPVSSSYLYRRHNFGIKPAMIRLELEKLSDEGFLEQPHHSAGRVPTDQGYEFFAERALGAEMARHAGNIHHIFHSMLAHRALPELVGELSDELGLLSVGRDRKSLYKEGLDNLVEHLHWSNDAEIRSVIKDFVDIDERLARVAEKLSPKDELKVFVGKKSPVTKSENLTVVMRACESDDGRVVLLAIGPKRMDYKKTLNIFKNL